jgi:lipase chaperone LimK
MNVSQNRVQTLEKLYAQGQTSDVIDLALEKLLAYELGETRQQLAQLERDLTEFEQRYDLSSETFYARFQAGEMGDAMDFVDWASLHQMAERLRQRIGLLEAA